jgi:hypothetical protein
MKFWNYFKISSFIIMGGKIFCQFTELLLHLTHFPHIKLILKHNLEYVYYLYVCSRGWQANVWFLKYMSYFSENFANITLVTWGKR